MATRYPAEFRRRAVELARRREKPIAQIAKDLGIAESGLRRWMAQADIAAQRIGPDTVDGIAPAEGWQDWWQQAVKEKRDRSPWCGTPDALELSA